MRTGKLLFLFFLGFSSGVFAQATTPNCPSSVVIEDNSGNCICTGFSDKDGMKVAWDLYNKRSATQSDKSAWIAGVTGRPSWPKPTNGCAENCGGVVDTSLVRAIKVNADGSLDTGDSNWGIEL